MPSSSAVPAIGPARTGSSGVLALVALASVAVLALCAGLSFRLAPGSDLATAFAANGARVALAAGAGAAFALAGTLRVAAGRTRPLGELALFGAASGAAAGGFLAVGASSGLEAALRFAAGALAGAGAAFALVRAIDRPRRATNLAAAGLLTLFLAATALAGTYARARRDVVAPIVAWLTGDLSGATAFAAALVIALATALAAAALRADERRRDTIAALALGLGLGAAGPLAFVGSFVPRTVRALAPAASASALLPASALAGAATVAAIDAVPRWLVGGYTLPWNVGAGMLAIPIFLGWNRARLRREVGRAPRAYEIVEGLVVAGMTGVAAWLVWTLARVIRAAT